MSSANQTNLPSEIFLGFDPGGKDRFGVAMISGSEASFETVSSIREAIHWSIEHAGKQNPIAAGIDTILHWSTGLGGFRSADSSLRGKYPKAANSVMAPNSLRGAMTIGGMGLAIELRKIWPTLLLNETHPKVLFHALTKQDYPREEIAVASDWLAREGKLNLPHPNPSEDEFDAIISAWATKEAFCQKWDDLSVVDDKHIHPIKGVRYYWPKTD